jgi:hypothetical protein
MNQKDWEAAYKSLLWQIEVEGCAVAGPGETTYECAADKPCGLCRLRSQRDAAMAACKLLLRSERVAVENSYLAFGLYSDAVQEATRALSFDTEE